MEVIVGLLKDKMQEHLNKIAFDTYEHFRKLTDKYQWMLDSGNNNASMIDFSPN